MLQNANQARERASTGLTCVPLPRGGVHLPVHLLGADGLRVEAAVLVRDAGGLVEGHAEAPENLRLTTAGRPHEHDAVPHKRGLVQLQVFCG